MKKTIFQNVPQRSLLLGIFLGLVACELGTPASQTPALVELGGQCVSSGECAKGLCLKLKYETNSRCIENCDSAGSSCASGSICTATLLASDSFVPVQATTSASGDPQSNICPPLPSCTSAQDCGANAACVPDTTGNANVCKCLTSFYGNPATSCSVCASGNSRPGCTLETTSFAEVKGSCRSLDGRLLGGDCRTVSDCPDTQNYGCFGYQPAIIADDPCACTDVRGLDLSAANYLGDIKRAWYDESTVWPEGFDPTVTGALGPGAQLSGVDLSGSPASLQSKPNTAAEVLTPDLGFDGQTVMITFTGANAISETPVTPGSLVLTVGSVVLTDNLEAQKLQADPPSGSSGTVDYQTGEIKLSLAVAPAASETVSATYDVSVPSEALTAVNLSSLKSVDLAFGEVAKAPLIPGSVQLSVTPETLNPDTPLDGQTKSLTFSQSNALAQAPVRPGSLSLNIGSLVLDDSGNVATATVGTLTASDGSSGSVIYSNGELQLLLNNAPPAFEDVSAVYEQSVSQALSPDQAYDGTTKSLGYSGKNSLKKTPVVAGSVSVTINGTTLTDQNADGLLSASDGSTGTVDYVTGTLQLMLLTAPPAEASATASFAKKSSIVLTDDAIVGVLQGPAGISGAIDYATGVTSIRLNAPAVAATQAEIKYDAKAPEFLVVTPALDGMVKDVQGTISASVTPHSLVLKFGPEIMTPTPAIDGVTTQFTFAGNDTLKKLPLAPGSLAVTVGALVLTDLAGDSNLTGTDGSTGQVNYTSGAVDLSLVTAPPTGTAVEAVYEVQQTTLTLNPDTTPDGAQKKLSFSDSNAVTRTPIVGGSAKLVVVEGLEPSTTFDGTVTANEITLSKAPVAPSTLKITVGQVQLSDDSGTGSLVSNDGSSGTIDYQTGRAVLSFMTAPASATTVSGDYDFSVSEESVSPETPFDGTITNGVFKTANGDLTTGSFSGTVAGVSLVDQGNGALLASDGSTGFIDYETGRLNVSFVTAPAALSQLTVSYTAGASDTLIDVDGAGRLVSPRGSSGRIDLRSGEISITTKEAQKSGAKFTLDFTIASELVITDTATATQLAGNDGSTGTIDYKTGAVSLMLAAAPPATTKIKIGFAKDVSVSDTSDLRTIALNSANLSSANLSYSDLSNAGLVNADLSGADLTGAILNGAKLNGANLSGANLSGATLEGANFTNTNLAGANLSGTTGLEPTAGGAPAWLAAGTVNCVESTDPNCIPGSYSPQAVVNAIVNGTLDPTSGVLEGAPLMGADLSGIPDLANAKLKGANLTGANLSGVKLAGADLSDAILKNANLDQVQAPDTVCATDGSPCYNEGQQCSGGVEACVVTDTAKLKLNRADLSGATIKEADLQGADLTDAVLTNIDASDAKLSRAKLVGSAGGELAPGTILDPKALVKLDLAGANLTGTKLDSADLASADLKAIKTSNTTDFSKAVMTAVDLETTTLSGAIFTEANLTGANLKQVRADAASIFIKANLTTAKLDQADLRGVDLSQANLTGASMTKLVVDEFTTMTGATMMGVDLSDACLTNSQILNGQTLMGATMQNIKLVGAEMNGADFSGVDLSGAQLGNPSAGSSACRCRPEGGPQICGSIRALGANFSGANFQNAELSDTDLRKLIMDGANFSKANLTRTDLREASLKKANFANSNLTTAVLTGGDFTEANFRSANLSTNAITDAKFISANFTQTNLVGTRFVRANMIGAVFDSVRSNGNTSLRDADMSTTAIVGCLKADLTGANFTNASLVRGALAAPNYVTDFNCRVNYEGSLFSSQTNTLCGNAFPSALITAGMDASGVYTQATALTDIQRNKTQMDCAYLPGVNLQGLNLAGASFRGANLNGIDLSRTGTGISTNLVGARLEKAFLTTSKLQWADLRLANLSQADLTGADLTSSDIRAADLRNTTISSATKFELAKYSCPGQSGGGCTKFPSFAGFRWRQLKMIGPQSDLGGIDLSAYPGLASPPVDLRNTNLKGSKFVWTELNNVNFSRANLDSANLSNASIRGANFGRANLKGANLAGSSISSSTNFGGSNIIEANFVGSSGTPRVAGSYCSEKTAFNSANPAYVLILEISIEGSFPFFFPVITVDLIPGWNVAGQCCFPVQGGIRLGC